VSPSPSLAELQRWMRWALTHPLGTAVLAGGTQPAGLPDRFGRPSSDVLPAIAADPVEGRTALDRLSVYSAGYFGRLHGALRLEYPRLAAALGCDGFRELVAAHLLRRPSSSPSLADLGEALEQTLRVQPGAVDSPWLVDLARVERAATEVWLSGADAPAPPARAANEDWAGLRLALAPAARLLRLEWDVADWMPDGAPPPRRSGWLVLWRVEGSTAVEWIDERSGAVLEALGQGSLLEEACALAGTLGMGLEEVTRDFGHWAAWGWLSLGEKFPGPPGWRDAA